LPGQRASSGAWFSGDGKYLASAGGEIANDLGEVKLWDTATWREALPLPGTQKGGLTSVAFSPVGGLLAAGCGDYRGKLWDLPNGTARPALEGHRGIVSAVAFSPDCRLLASGSGDNSVIF
jgi:WD40 repeat protein